MAEPLRPDGVAVRRGRRDPHPRPHRDGRGATARPPRHAWRGADHRGVPRGARRRRPRRAALRRHLASTRRSRPAEGTRGSGGADDIEVDVPGTRRRQRPGAPVRRRGRLAVVAPRRRRTTHGRARPGRRAADVPDPQGRRPRRRAGRRRPPRHPRRDRQEGPQGPGLPARRPGARQGRRPLRPQVGGQEPAQPGALDDRRRLPHVARPTSFTDADWATLREGRALLLVHGTFSTAHGGFGSLPKETMAALHAAYDGRVAAFEHHSISVTPKENADLLAGLVPDGTALEVDLVTHSRGGLVGREIAGASRALDVAGLVMVASPNAGTVLADRRAPLRPARPDHRPRPVRARQRGHRHPRTRASRWSSSSRSAPSAASTGSWR